MPAPARRLTCTAGRGEGADQDVQIQVAVAVQITQRAGVGAARLALQCGDDLHAAHLRTTGDGTARESCRNHLAGRHAGAQTSAHIGDDVMNVGVTLHHHQLVDLDRARHADATEIVALQVDQHHVFGALLRVRGQFADRSTSSSSASRGRVPAIGRVCTMPSRDLDQTLGRRTDHSPSRLLQQPGEGRRIGAPQRAHQNARAKEARRSARSSDATGSPETRRPAQIFVDARDALEKADSDPLPRRQAVAPAAARVSAPRRSAASVSSQ